MSDSATSCGHEPGMPSLNDHNSQSAHTIKDDFIVCCDLGARFWHCIAVPLQQIRKYKEE